MEEAVALLGELIAALPDQGVLHFDRAVCLIKLHRLPEARRLLESFEAQPGQCITRHGLLAAIAAL